MCTLNAEAQKAAAERSEQQSSRVEGQTDKTATFKDLLQKSSAISVGLRDQGVTAGDYVIICCEKSIAAFSALLGVVFTGATAVMYPIPHVDDVPQLTRGFPIKAVFCDRQYLDPLTASMTDMKKPVVVAITEPQDQVFDSLLKSEGKFEVYDVKDVKKHVPMIFFSSGTTGDPKGILMSDVGVQLSGRFFNIKVTSFFVQSPIFWLSALVSIMSAAFTCFKIVISNSPDPKENLNLLEKHKVDIWFAGTGSVPRYLNEPSLPDHDLSALQALCVGGETLLSSVAEDLNTKLLRGRVHLVTGYGSTEGGMLSGVNVTLEKGEFEYGWGGKPNAGVEMKVVDDDGEIVPIGSLGQVCLRSPGLTPGYWGRPELNQEAFDKDGFFRSGDVGFFKQEGQIYLRGRVGDLINYKGTKVSPAEAEDILMSHPEVMDAAVVGKPHPTDIQHPTAYVVRVPGSNVTGEDLRAIVNGKVADNLKLVGGVHFLDVLPRTIIGKIRRKVLREL